MTTKTKKVARVVGSKVTPKPRATASTAGQSLEAQRKEEAGLKLAAMLLHLHDMMTAHQQAAVSKPYVWGPHDATLTRFTTEDVQKFRHLALSKAVGL